MKRIFTLLNNTLDTRHSTLDTRHSTLDILKNLISDKNYNNSKKIYSSLYIFKLIFVLHDILKIYLSFLIQKQSYIKNYNHNFILLYFLKLLRMNFFNDRNIFKNVFYKNYNLYKEF